MNPYRKIFYSRQAEWHAQHRGAHQPDALRREFELRAKYYRWYTQDWLPADRSAPALDIGCGSGQFVYFLKHEGWTHAAGIDLDEEQTAMGRDLGLDCSVMDSTKLLADRPNHYQLISLLDIIEHFTLEELYPFLQQVVDSLKPGGTLIVSVPNADSPVGLHTRYSDITHEESFSILSLRELFFCHDLELVGIRDPWPAPIDFKRALYKRMVDALRRLEGLKWRLLGLGESPEVWSSVVWAAARKPLT
jgi:SAM-dependent methyltransferase